MFSVFEKHESEVRGYCRAFPVMFEKGKGSIMYSNTGERYVDFWAGAGSMGFGHNNPYVKNRIMEYLSGDNLVAGLDLYTTVTEKFLTTFNEVILAPRGLNHKVMFCNASGANCVEAALKIARLAKKRENIIAFTGSYHGQSLGALSVTSGVHGRSGAGVPLCNVTFAPYASDLETEEMSIKWLEKLMTDDHSGVPKPAAIILEAVQGEGGIIPPSAEWLRSVRAICDKYDILMICDEIQAGTGRTGRFFAFERAEIIPDIITVSKSISGFGLPLAMVLVKPEIDVFDPGQHTGTFRGNQLSLVGATATVEMYRDEKLDVKVQNQEKIVRAFMDEHILPLDERIVVRGIGLFWGIDLSGLGEGVTKKMQKKALENHLVADICGRDDCVFKLLPPITIEDEILTEGLEIIEKSLKEVLAEL